MATLNPSAMSAAISQGYQAPAVLPAGTLVSIDSDTNKVAAASTNNSNGLLGVVVGANAATLAITNASNELQVATTGTANLFISNLNGPVGVGDQIAPSAIEGVGMKASADGKVVGTAQKAFNGKQPLKTITIKTVSGGTKTVAIGVIPVVVQVIYYTVPVKAAVPFFLQQFADSVAGKPVAVARLALVGIILIAALLIVAILLFSAVRGSIVSIGRNPLARRSIYRSLFQATAASMAILAVAVGGAYVVLLY
jgi:RNase P/RNase MRP subunit p29